MERVYLKYISLVHYFRTERSHIIFLFPGGRHTSWRKIEKSSRTFFFQLLFVWTINVQLYICCLIWNNFKASRAVKKDSEVCHNPGGAKIIWWLFSNQFPVSRLKINCIYINVYISQGEKNVQTDRALNPRPFVYRANALQSDPSGCLTHYLPYGDYVRTYTPTN